MKWLELSVSSPPEFVEPLSQIFYRYGHGGVAIEQQGGFNPDEGESPCETAWMEVKTYLPINPTTAGRRSRIEVGVSLVARVCPISQLRERVLEEEEWESSWKEHFYPLRVGKHIVVCPSWRRFKGQKNDVIITLDPGMAFGTGHHPTTHMCLERLEAMIKADTDVLDLGCGSGILSITAAKLGARSVLGLEIDSVSVGVSKQNLRENKVGANVRIAQGSLPHPDARPNSYDVAVANISAKVVSDVAGELVRAVKPGGAIIGSGILLDNRSWVEQAIVSAGGRIEHTFVDGEWVTIEASVP